MRKKGAFSEVFKYIMAAIVAVVVIFLGYSVVSKTKDSACRTELQKFQLEHKSLGTALRAGETSLKEEKLPCQADSIYFLDLSKDIDPSNFAKIPVIKDSVQSKGSDNVFIVKEGIVRSSFFAGNLEMKYPYFLCLKPRADKISFKAEGLGKTTMIESDCDTPHCTFTNENPKTGEIPSLKTEAEKFSCGECLFSIDESKIESTSKKLDILRKTTNCHDVTDFEIKLLPKSTLKKLRVYIIFPDICVDLFSDIDTPRGKFFKDKNHMLWRFEELNSEIDLNFKIKKDLDEGCIEEMKIFTIENG